MPTRARLSPRLLVPLLAAGLSLTAGCSAVPGDPSAITRPSHHSPESHPANRPVESHPANRPVESHPANRPVESHPANRPVESHPANREELPLVFAPPSPLTGGPAISAVSCAGPTTCMALDTGGDAYHFHDRTWSPASAVPSLSPGPGTPALSCPADGSCLAEVGGGSSVAIRSPTSWSTPVTLPGATGIEAIGCARTGFCIAVDGEGNSFMLDQGEWSPTSGDWGSVSAISCVGPTFCMSAAGGVSRWNGSTWTVPATLGAVSVFTGISCPDATVCAAVDELGQAAFWNGQTWSAPASISPSKPRLTAISCPDPSLCVATADSGQIYLWITNHPSTSEEGGTSPNGGAGGVSGRWYSLDVDEGVALTGISCPSRTECLIGDATGSVVFGRALAGPVVG